MLIKNGDIFYSDDGNEFNHETEHCAVEMILAYDELINDGDIVTIYSGEVDNITHHSGMSEFGIIKVKEIKVKIINADKCEFELLN